MGEPLFGLPPCPPRWWDGLPNGWELSQSHWDSASDAGWIKAYRGEEGPRGEAAFFRFRPSMPGTLILILSAPDAEALLAKARSANLILPDEVEEALEWEAAGKGVDRAEVKVTRDDECGYVARIGDHNVVGGGASEMGAMKSLAQSLYDMMREQRNLARAYKNELKGLRPRRAS